MPGLGHRSLGNTCIRVPHPVWGYMIINERGVGAVSATASPRTAFSIVFTTCALTVTLGRKKNIQTKNTQGFDGLWATSPAWQAGFCNRRLVRKNSSQFFVCSGSLSKTIRNGRTHKLFEARQLSRTNPCVSANSTENKKKQTHKLFLGFLPKSPSVLNPWPQRPPFNYQFSLAIFVFVCFFAPEYRL